MLSSQFTANDNEPAAQDRGGLVRIRLDISYDGTDFSGWARQPALRTVCGVLEDALSLVYRRQVSLTVAGRTDAGVHATGQVAHVDLPEGSENGLVRRFARLLPTDVRIRAASRVPPEFDARFAALRRHYRYRIVDAPYGVEPLRRRDTLAWPRTLDSAAMNAAAADLLGEHDFAAYCKAREGATTIRELQRLRIDRDADGVLRVEVSADAFCHSMVRGLVGALLAVGDGRRAEPWPASLLPLRTRSTAVTVAPAHGLTLVGVDYPAPSELAQRIALTRNLRAR